MNEAVLNFNHMPKFVIAGVPKTDFGRLRTTVWLTKDGINEYRPTTRADFALWSLDPDAVAKVFDQTFQFASYDWKIRVRAGSRRVFTD